MISLDQIESNTYTKNIVVAKIKTAISLCSCQYPRFISKAEKCSGENIFAETVFEVFGSNSFVENDNQGSDTTAVSTLLVPEQPTVHSEEATFGCLQRSLVDWNFAMAKLERLEVRCSTNHKHELAFQCQI